MSEPIDDVLPGIGSALQLQTAPEQIADRLLAAIAVGVLYPGERLPSERDLAVQLRVSRPTLRFALQRLAALGVLEARRGRGGGTFVREVRPNSEDARAIVNVLEPLWAQFEQMLDYRNLIHQIIARTAAARRTPTDVAAMQAALTAYAQANTATDSRRADHALHDAVAIATQNRQLLTLSRSLTSAVNLGFSADPYSEELHQRALCQHTDLIGAIVAGEGERALHIAAEHFRVTSTEPWHRALSRSQLRLTDDD